MSKLAINGGTPVREKETQLIALEFWRAHNLA